METTIDQAIELRRAGNFVASRELLTPLLDDVRYASRAHLHIALKDAKTRHVASKTALSSSNLSGTRSLSSIFTATLLSSSKVSTKSGDECFG